MRHRMIHNEFFRQLHSEDFNIRVAAAYGLGKMKVRRGIKHLGRALHDQIPEVRYYAAWALGMIRDPKAFVYLNIAKLDNDARVQCAIENALRRVTQPSADSLIDTLVNHPNPQQRSQAAKMLGMLCESQALGILVDALKDPSLRVRVEAVQAIGSLGALEPESQAWAGATTQVSNLEIRHAVKRLMVCLQNDAAPLVRAEAAKAIGHLLGSSTLPEPRWKESPPEVPVNSSDGIGRETASFLSIEGRLMGSF